jgi:hypothetical protein
MVGSVTGRTAGLPPLTDGLLGAPLAASRSSSNTALIAVASAAGSGTSAGSVQMPTHRTPFQPSAPTASGARGASGRIGYPPTSGGPARLSWTLGPGMLDTIAWKNAPP